MAEVTSHCVYKCWKIGNTELFEKWLQQLWATMTSVKTVLFRENVRYLVWACRNIKNDHG